MAVKEEILQDLPLNDIAAHWAANGSYPTNLIPPSNKTQLSNGVRKGNRVKPNGVKKTNGVSSPNGSIESSQLRIAIVGGGLAGAASAIALSRLPEVQIKVYERSETPREVGALIGVMVSALKSLSRVLSADAFETLQGLLYKGHNVDGIVNRFWRTGEIMTTQISPHTPRVLQEGRTGRVALYNLLLNEIAEGVVEYGKKVVRVENLDEKNHGIDKGIRLHFADGGTEDADLVVAADGLYSKLRKQYNPSESIAYRGRVAYRYNFPVSLVEHIEGLPNDTSAWRSNSEAVFLSRIDPGYYSFLAFIPETEEHAATLQWAKAIGKSGVERIGKRFIDWDPIITEVIKVLPDANAYPLQAAPWMDKLYYDDSIVFIGDAAHPTSGDYGGGCSFAFADVRALYLSLWRTYNTKPYTKSNFKVRYNVPYALHLYNETRIHFLKRVKKQMANDRLDSAYIAGSGDDDAEWIRRYREVFTLNWWLLEHDVDERWQEVEAEERHHWITPEDEKAAKRLKTIYGD
ncbi:salicylate hydroxylase [Xylogone sp. PMI_703]|nr:salicylate hydroxylase [Xylogone sp. PMI_703]